MYADIPSPEVRRVYPEVLLSDAEPVGFSPDVPPGPIHFVAGRGYGERDLPRQRVGGL